MRFDEFDFNYDVLDALDAMRFSECTPIQEKAIPLALDGRDLIAVAQTGTGKTAAYLLPVLSRLADGRFPEDAVNCIVMAPTRELAMQIDRQLEGFGYFLKVSSLAVYGGTDGATFARQQKSLLTGADVVIATPGRLLAHLQLGKIDLSRVSFFILDEADRMLDMGFYDDIMQVVKHLPAERQTLMFSATMPPKIQQLARTILRDPAEIKLAVSRPADGIHQQVAMCYESAKLPLLKHIFKHVQSERVIVFASSKLKVKDLYRDLRRNGVRVGEMHSDLDQSARDEVMHNFKFGHIDVLVATDIVARGIDIDDIKMVVNFDVPHDAEDYVHRIGRTARAGAGGDALTFVSDRDRRRWTDIERFLGKAVERYPIPESIGATVPDKPDHAHSRHPRRQSSAPRNQRAAGKRRSDKPNTDNQAAAPSQSKRQPSTHRRRSTRRRPSDSSTQ